MTELLFDEEIASGASAAGTVTRVDQDLSTDFAFYLDSESADITFEVYMCPDEDDVATGTRYRAAVEDEKNVDITNGLVYHPETRGCSNVEVQITNNGPTASTIRCRADEYQKS